MADGQRGAIGRPIRRALVRSGVALGRVMYAAGVDLPHLSAARLIDRAENMAGTDDWADLHPEVPLQYLLGDLDRAAHLHLPGKLAARFDLLRMLHQRLLVESSMRRRPDLRQVDIHRPVFIVGLPRSGTTALHGLLARDPAVRAPATWETMYPVPWRTDDAADAARRRALTQRRLPWMDAMAPAFQRAHPLEAEEPQECINITAHTLYSHQFWAMYRAPAYQAWLDSVDHLAAYRYHRRFLQYLQRHDVDGSLPRRWVLKAPAHLYCLDELFSVYPDAAVVFTHRDPREVFSSLASLTVNMRSAFSDGVQPEAVAREMLDAWSHALARGLQARERLEDRHPGAFVDIEYPDLVGDPETTVRNIYRHFGWSWTSGYTAALREQIRLRPQHRRGVHHHRLADFKLREADIYQALGSYSSRFL